MKSYSNINFSSLFGASAKPAESTGPAKTGIFGAKSQDQAADKKPSTLFSKPTAGGMFSANPVEPKQTEAKPAEAAPPAEKNIGGLVSNFGKEAEKKIANEQPQPDQKAPEKSVFSAPKKDDSKPKENPPSMFSLKKPEGAQPPSEDQKVGEEKKSFAMAKFSPEASKTQPAKQGVSSVFGAPKKDNKEGIKDPNVEGVKPSLFGGINCFITNILTKSFVFHNHFMSPVILEVKI